MCVVLVCVCMKGPHSVCCVSVCLYEGSSQCALRCVPAEPLPGLLPDREEGPSLEEPL